MTIEEAKRHGNAPVEITIADRTYNGEIIEVATDIRLIKVRGHWPLHGNHWVRADNLRLQSDIVGIA